MAKAKQVSKKSGRMKGLKTVGGVAAGAALGALAGPVGAAVGAVVGGVAGANADNISESKTAKRLASATKKGIQRIASKSKPGKAVAPARVKSAASRTRAKANSRKRKG